MLSVNYPISNPAERECELDTAMTEGIEMSLPSKHERQQHARRPDDQNVKGNENVGRN